VKPPAGSRLATWVPAGTITIGTGNNVWAGGDNQASSHFPQGSYQGRGFGGQSRFTDTFLKRDGRWFCVATHGSNVE
jgi:hypothetical protein